jgi:hypothetical protein
MSTNRLIEKKKNINSLKTNIMHLIVLESNINPIDYEELSNILNEELHYMQKLLESYQNDEECLETLLYRKDLSNNLIRISNQLNDIDTQSLYNREYN